MTGFLKRAAALLCAAVLLAGCGAQLLPPENERIEVVATLFPQYDFARQIAGARADVTLLLPPGVESHAYEPTPADIIRINQADVFLYTGAYMEPWAQKLIEGLDGDVQVVDVSAHVPLEEESHDHEGHDHDGHGGFDPHIWTNPQNAKVMVDNIAAALSAADPAGSGLFMTNAADYKAQLDELDETIMEIVGMSEHREIVFGGRFAMRYFAEHYGLAWSAAFDSCSGETEPSVRAVAQIIDNIQKNRIPVIYYEELTDPKVARAIARESGAQPLLLHSCHNVSKDELAAGATYLSLMEQNAENLKRGLNGWR